ncbi:MAG: hypothetical protein QOF51_726 [Chloroflexota bacterium]|jgi:hypothetical protein|nr:hypothetical protein [Chloroflexota bacterium]
METVVPLLSFDTVKSTQSPATAPRRAERIARLARRLAQAIADSADADQATISIDGIDGLGPTTPPQLVPREWLIALNNGKPGIYRVCIRLRAAGQQFGMLRLATIRPSGFQADDVARAHMDAFHASEMLATALECTSWAAAEPTPDGVLDIESFRQERTSLDPLATLAG